jgi:hypothetical protein
MSDNKPGESFFRKVVRFVANPATDWKELTAQPEDNKELELEKSELKAMIERKRRNDFVRKREFDMLRKVRREGLSPEQLAMLGSSSKLDPESRTMDSRITSDVSGVKAKIDEIEQQMVGDPAPGSAAARRHAARIEASRPQTPPLSAPPAARDAVSTPLQLEDSLGARVIDTDDDDEQLPPLPPLPDIDLPPPPAPAPVQMAARLPPLSPLSPLSPVTPVSLARTGHVGDASASAGVEVSEVVHDPDLDEAVIAFANADFAGAEGSLQRLTAFGGPRATHAETWLVLFDLYRATGQQLRFESLALDYAQQFGWSAPQWFSLPQLVADAVAEERPKASARIGGAVSWMCPPQLDVESVTRLRAQTMQTPLPWVFDWQALKGIDAEAAMQLSTLFRLWAGQALEMRWIGGERLLAALREAAPTGVRDADPVFWLTRLDALRLVNRPDHFDEAAIDYCVTYEVSPPSWEPARCHVHVSESSHSTRLSSVLPSEMSTSFLESSILEDSESGAEMANVELSGQLVGDIGKMLSQMTTQLGGAPLVSVSCARLIRVDFVAAGDLLNWVLTTGSGARSVQFVDAHRLVALFFGAMGINEHARVQVRKV